MKPLAATAAALILSVAASGCTRSVVEDSPSAAPPPSAAAASVRNGACEVRWQQVGDPFGQAPLTVGREPRNVVAIWIPGLNSLDRCAAVRVSYDASVATRLAVDVDGSPVASDAPRACPADDGTAVELWFGYAGGRTERVDVNLTGCLGITAAARHARDVSPRLLHDLAAVAPPPWAAALSAQFG